MNFFNRLKVKYGIFISGVCMILAGCGTIGGAMQGAGEDLTTAGQYIRSVGK
jgi:predicted small secreted protein